MAFYQNISEQEFRANLLLGDRQYVIEFVCAANRNTSNCQLAWNGELYDFSSVNTLTLNYAWDVNFKNYSTLSINVAGAIPAATTAAEVAAILNANVTFAEMFVAQVKTVQGIMLPGTPGSYTVIITPQSGRVKPQIRLWINNAGAEQKLGFNKKASVSDMPNYMDRHTVANRFNFPDSQGILIKLSHTISNISVAASTVITSVGHGLVNGDTITIYQSNSTPLVDGTHVVTVIDEDTFTIPVTVTVAGDTGYFVTPVESAVITNAGFDPSASQPDWQLLAGRASGIYAFQKLTVDASNRITQIIEYGAGAKVGDLARKINYIYTGAFTSPSQITEIPYVLTSADLVTPP